MRPSIRYALISLGVLLGVVGALYAVSRPPVVTPPPIPADLPRQPVRPEGVEPVEPPVVGAPSPAQRAEVLDQLEAVDEERLGPAEAARRRRVREQLLRERIERGTPAR